MYIELIDISVLSNKIVSVIGSIATNMSPNVVVCVIKSIYINMLPNTYADIDVIESINITILTYIATHVGHIDI